MSLPNLPNLPNLPCGSIISDPPNLNEILNLKEKEKIRQQHRHDYKIAFIGIIGGGIAGFVSSMLVWLITHQF